MANTHEVTIERMLTFSVSSVIIFTLWIQKKYDSYIKKAMPKSKTNRTHNGEQSKNTAKQKTKQKTKQKLTRKDIVQWFKDKSTNGLTRNELLGILVSAGVLKMVRSAFMNNGPDQDERPSSRQPFDVQREMLAAKKHQNIGFDFDGVLHTCVMEPPQEIHQNGKKLYQYHPNWDMIHSLIESGCKNDEIIKYIQQLIKTKKNVFIMSHNTELGKEGIQNFLSKCQIHISPDRIIAELGNKGELLNKHKVSLFYDDSSRVLADIKHVYKKCVLKLYHHKHGIVEYK